MTDMITALIILLAICLLYVLSTMCRTGHTGLQKLRGWHYTHRGLHGNGVPENSLEAFQKSIEASYGAELDVHLLADGNLAVIHDSDLRRVTGREGRVEELTVSQLGDHKLCETDNFIPEFEKVLELFAGQVPLIIELKVVGNNYAALCERVCKALDGYEGVYCLESFDPRCIYWLRKNRPDIIRGQLVENYFKTEGGKKLPWILRFLLTNQMLNFLTLPDFVAYRQEHRKNLGSFLVKKLWRTLQVAWVIKTQQEHDAVISEGWISIFENFTP